MLGWVDYLDLNWQVFANRVLLAITMIIVNCGMMRASSPGICLSVFATISINNYYFYKHYLLHVVTSSEWVVLNKVGQFWTLMMVRALVPS